jgi:hypothetical protein
MSTGDNSKVSFALILATGVFLVYLSFSNIRHELGLFYGISAGMMVWPWFAWIVALAFVLWPYRHFFPQEKLEHVVRETALVTAEDGLALAKIKAQLSPLHTRLAFELQETLYRQAIAEGLPVEFVTGYRNQRMTVLLEPLVKRELSRIGIDEHQGRTNVDLDAKEREARSQINMLQLAAEVKKTLDEYIRENNPGPKS